jgi:hypothetical protein
MTIWLLALLLLASLAGFGYGQGAVRMAFALGGTLFGVLLAGPLGKLLRPVLVLLGVKNPTLSWVLAPFIVFVLVSIAFQVAGLMVHRKVDVYYKYKAGDLRLALWERLSQRLGLCLGLLNGAIYLILISFVIYNMSYWTAQIASDDSDPKSIRLLNRLGKDLQSSGFAKVARAVDPMPEAWYQTADLAGILYNNPLLEARLSRYPGFLGLADRPEFQDLASDNQFTEMRQRREPIKNIYDYPKAQAILGNPDLLRTIWSTLQPDLNDLPKYLETGKSPKYSAEAILGRWNFDVNAAVGIYLRAHPNTASSEMQKMKKWFVMAFSKTTLVAKTDHQITLKNAPQLKAAATAGAPAPGNQTLEGQWKNLDGKYQLSVSSGGDLAAAIDGDRMTITGEGINMVFQRED